MASSWTWSDGWLLMALVPTAKNGKAHLVDILGAADCLNHAIPTRSELNQALTRFRQCGLLLLDSSPFEVDPVLHAEVKNIAAKTRGLFNLPDAGKEWLEGNALPRLNGAEVKIGEEEMEAAYEAYVGKLGKR